MQASGHYPAFRSAALGLLAVAAHVCDSAESTTTVFSPRSFSDLVWEKVPLFALAAASAGITIKAQSSGGATGWYPLSIRIGNAIVSYASYLGKAFWPARLAPMYPHPGYSLNPWHVAAAFLLLLAITGLVVVGRRHRYLPVGWFWFLGTLVPMLGLKQVGSQAMADRYAYLPFIGLFIMVCWGDLRLGRTAASFHRLAGRPEHRCPVGLNGGELIAKLASGATM